MVKIWRPNLDYGWAEAGITDSEQGIIFGNVSLNTRTGNRLVGVFSNLKMEVSVDTDDIWLDSFMCGSALVVSGKLKMLLEEFGTNVQYIAFEIFSTNTQLSGKTFFTQTFLMLLNVWILNVAIIPSGKKKDSLIMLMASTD